MGARTKLNEMYLAGSLLWAAFIGLVFNSWMAFAAAVGGPVALQMVGGNIRLARARR